MTERQKNILIVDDDTSILASLALVLKQAGYKTVTATNAAEALQELQRETFSLVIQDMNYTRKTDGEEGLALLGEIKSKYPLIPVILITAWGSISLAVKGMQQGASDFITKPWTNEQVIQAVITALGLAESTIQSSEKTLSREALDEEFDFSGIIGRDTKLLKILSLIGRVCKTDASVLITGESGTGKELIADAIHQNSYRRQNPFVKVNLGSLPAPLFESELFGHLKGAFTDAKSDRKGRFESADSGTIFLDEIGDLDFSCQVKLLRVLQERTFEPVGSSKTKTVNVRVVSATNRNLSAMIQSGNFREDLLYRLNLISIHLPPLRERTGDIPILADYFLLSAARLYGRDSISIAAPAMKWLQSRTWQGNIRELKHLIERTVLMTSSKELSVQDFINAENEQDLKRASVSLPAVGSMTLDDIEKAMIEKAIAAHSGNVSRVADALGLSRAALYRRFEKYGITI